MDVWRNGNVKALVVYDSFFGNTERVARAIASSLGPPAEVTVVKVSDVTPAQLTGLSHLIVGSPTRGFRPTPAIVEFLKGIPAGSLTGVKVAAFDTSIPKKDMPFFIRLGGYAAKPISEALKEKGGELVLPPEAFYVEKGEQGPLKDGEVERAGCWFKASQDIDRPPR
jgi:flavodoxin I